MSPAPIQTRLRTPESALAVQAGETIPRGAHRTLRVVETRFVDEDLVLVVEPAFRAEISGSERPRPRVPRARPLVDLFQRRRVAPVRTPSAEATTPRLLATRVAPAAVATGSGEVGAYIASSNGSVVGGIPTAKTVVAVVPENDVEM